MHACLVWDGDSTVRVPPPVGSPHSGQMKGSTGEQLIEVCTRLCYDSMGLDSDGEPKGRDTADTLRNVMDVYHGSVLEHYVRTIGFDGIADEAFTLAFMNRPGCWLRQRMPGHARATMNVRAVVEWDQWSERLLTEHGFDPQNGYANIWRWIGERIRVEFAREVPLLVTEQDRPMQWPAWLTHADIGIVEPETDAEKWVTLYLVGSRGFSHEMVRHRFAMSQRSTRYCEEGESRWHWHPLIGLFMNENPHLPILSDLLLRTQRHAQETYSAICDELQEWLVKKLPAETPYRKKHARKQARGAARGFLGNALETQMCYTAPVWAWKHIVNMRAADAADAEIRVVISEAVPALQSSRYGDRFADLVLVPASDGMGMALKGGGHK